MTKNLILTAALTAATLLGLASPATAATNEVPTTFSGQVTITRLPHTSNFNKGMMAACFRSRGKIGWASCATEFGPR